MDDPEELIKRKQANPIYSCRLKECFVVLCEEYSRFHQHNCKLNQFTEDVVEYFPCKDHWEVGVLDELCQDTDCKQWMNNIIGNCKWLSEDVPMPPDEIALALRMPVSDIKFLLRNALQKVRAGFLTAYLKEEGSP